MYLVARPLIPFTLMRQPEIISFKAFDESLSGCSLATDELAMLSGANVASEICGLTKIGRNLYIGSSQSLFESM